MKKSHTIIYEIKKMNKNHKSSQLLTEKSKIHNTRQEKQTLEFPQPISLLLHSLMLYINNV